MSTRDRRLAATPPASRTRYLDTAPPKAAAAGLGGWLACRGSGGLSVASTYDLLGDLAGHLAQARSGRVSKAGKVGRGRGDRQLRGRHPFRAAPNRVGQ